MFIISNVIISNSSTSENVKSLLKSSYNIDNNIYN
jgi:hypothetical protein